MRREIGIEIDELTLCLRRLSDGSVVQTYVEQLSQQEVALCSRGWEFDWRTQLRESDKVIGLFVEGDLRPQGLVALTNTSEISAVTLDLAESAPWNSGHSSSANPKEFVGVGGHLFAIAVKESYAQGYNGFVSFVAKTNLIDYYHDAFGATRLGNTTSMYLDEVAARRLYERYYGYA